MQPFDDYLTTHHDRFITELKAFVAQPSVAATGLGMAQMADLVRAHLARVGATVQTIETGGAPILLATLGQGPRTLLIYNHYDVQPPDPIDLWTTPPFEPDVRDGKLYARGISDNKGDLLCRLHAIEAWQHTLGELPFKITWVIEGEEEVGSPHLADFARAYADQLRADGCLWETGGKNEDDRIGLTMGLKGIQYLELRVRGAKRDLHSGYAAIAPSPVWRLIWALNTLKDEHDTITIDGYLDHVRAPNAAEVAMLQAMPFDETKKLAALGIDRFINDEHGLAVLKRFYYGPTVTICGIQSGYTGEGMKTVLPNYAFAKIDCRLVPNLTPDLCISLLRAHLDRRGFTDVEVVPLSGEHPALSPVEADIVTACQSAAREVYQHEPVMIPLSPGSGPMYPLTAALNIPTVMAGIGYSDARAHAPDENIRLSDYVEGLRFIGRLIERFATRE
ncbi:MAG: M20/M25/M40 family metallo-hydrolase [Thermoflexales bacterium]|nr:M20/M25/M40 family metallo-hydrolase [Thermoflexales bacterium]